MIAFKGLNVILGLYKCNYSSTRGKELGTAAGKKQGAGPDSAPGPVFATCALEELTGLSESFMPTAMVCYRQGIQIKISQRKRCIGQSLGRSKHRARASTLLGDLLHSAYPCVTTYMGNYCQPARFTCASVPWVFTGPSLHR